MKILTQDPVVLANAVQSVEDVRTLLEEESCGCVTPLTGVVVEGPAGADMALRALQKIRHNSARVKNAVEWAQAACLGAAMQRKAS